MDLSKLRKEKPREFDALVAEKVMGWVWLERIHDGGGKTELRKALFPPEKNADGWERCNFFADNWRPAQEETERFSDWDRCCVKHQGRHIQSSLFGLPSYLSVLYDYSLLCHVRKRWNKKYREKFSSELIYIFDASPGVLPDPMQYHVGDYAEAALRVVMKEAL